MANTRSIFEDVSENAQKNAPAPKAPKSDQQQAVRTWLWLLFGLVVIMVLVGGATRLTDSGLSITEWDLLMGTLPPMSHAAWQELFDKYQQTQEFIQINSSMTLLEFEKIFWWEWGHRFLGRIIGLVWIIGFLLFTLKKSMPRDRTRSLFVLGVLIGLQGVIGILMVKTGYIGARVDVASYALATHLGMAFVILGIIYWNIRLLALSAPERVEARRRGSSQLYSRGRLVLALVFLQILLGALVAGIDAGRSYTDWPLMGGEFFSSDSFVLTPFWTNFFENPALVQFMHRMNGYILLVLAIWLWLSTRQASYKEWRRAGQVFALAIIAQIIMGIVALMRGAPLWESLTHQGLAILVWVVVLGNVFGFRYPKPQSIREG